MILVNKMDNQREIERIADICIESNFELDQKAMVKLTSQTKAVKEMMETFHPQLDSKERTKIWKKKFVQAGNTERTNFYNSIMNEIQKKNNLKLEQSQLTTTTATVEDLKNKNEELLNEKSKLVQINKNLKRKACEQEKESLIAKTNYEALLRENGYLKSQNEKLLGMVTRSNKRARIN